MATNKARDDRFNWKEGDVVFPPGFKTKAERIKDGSYKPASERPVKKTRSTGKKSGK